MNYTNIGFCSECQYRDITGHCQSKKLDEDIGYNNDIKDNMLLYDYTEGGGFWVGPHFGCIHFTHKT